MEEFDCLQSYVGVATTCRRVTPLHAYAGDDPFAKGQRTPEQAPDYRSPQCFRYGINEQILFEVGIRTDIERFIEGMIRDNSDVDRSHFL